MALVLIKEDGTGRVDANAYADVADADAYHEGHLYATAWTAATAEQKATALVMASRLIDSLYQFGGTRVAVVQGLQWPRYGCYDPDGVDGGLYVAGVSYRFQATSGFRQVSDNIVPLGVRSTSGIRGCSGPRSMPCGLAFRRSSVSPSGLVPNASP